MEKAGFKQKTVLATVADINGSSCRQPGARILIKEESRTTVGAISGGCLETDVIEGAKRVIKTGRPEVITYDTRATDDSNFSLNLRCNPLPS